MASKKCFITPVSFPKRWWRDLVFLVRHKFTILRINSAIPFVLDLFGTRVGVEQEACQIVKQKRQWFFLCDTYHDITQLNYFRGD